LQPILDLREIIAYWIKKQSLIVKQYTNLAGLVKIIDARNGKKEEK
jgi:hypothetical protein